MKMAGQFCLRAFEGRILAVSASLFVDVHNKDPQDVHNIAPLRPKNSATKEQESATCECLEENEKNHVSDQFY